MAAAISMLRLLDVHQPQVSFVDEGRRKKRLSGGLVDHFLGGEPPPLVVNQGQELVDGVRIALLDGGQNSSDVAHRRGTPGVETRRNVRTERPEWRRIPCPACGRTWRADRARLVPEACE